MASKDADIMKVKLKLETQITPDDKIIMKLMNERGEEISEWLVDTVEKSTREALIFMGWTPPGGGWIKSTDAQPEVNARVIAYNPDNLFNIIKQIITWYPGDEKSWTHWMPLPENPKE